MTPDPSQLADALLFWKLIGITVIVVSAINGVLQIIVFFRKQPPLEDVLRKLEKRWDEQDKVRIKEQAEAETKREAELNERLGLYLKKTEHADCADRHDSWTTDVEKRAVHQVEESEKRALKRFDEVREDYKSLNKTLQEVAQDVALLAGKST